VPENELENMDDLVAVADWILAEKKFKVAHYPQCNKKEKPHYR
jgi:hypothetical protein